MVETRSIDDVAKPELYRELCSQLEALPRSESDAVANAANTSALVFHLMPRLNWVGFYFLHGSELVLGPFQGKPACVRTPVGEGVCGTAVARRQSVVVADVHAFPGHIARDPASRSELVVPLVRRETVLGVIGLDGRPLRR